MRILLALLMLLAAAAYAAEGKLRAGVFEPPRPAPDFSLAGSDGSELKREWVAGARIVGLTAGASAPERLVEEVIDKLREIEAALELHPAVRECVVEAREEAPDTKRLVAYVVTSDKLQVTSREDSSLVTGHSLLVTELRSFLKERLPAPIAGQVDNAVAGSAGVVGGITDKAGDVLGGLGGMFGGKKE